VNPPKLRRPRWQLKIQCASEELLWRPIRSITEICEEYLKDRYILEIIDIYKNPTLAKGEQIIAAPTLIKELPSPLRKFIGDLADREKVLVGLNLKPMDEEINH
jgi:circadian clock protein KaiB